MSDLPFFNVGSKHLMPRLRMSHDSGFFESLFGRIVDDDASPRPIIPDADEASIDLIMRAVEQNDKRRLIQILKKRKREPLPLPANDKKWTALHLAASKPECKECLELLFEYDNYSILVNRDSQTSLGETALHIACEYGCEENVYVLLQKDCDREKKTCAGYSPLHIAASRGCIKIVRYLLGHSVNGCSVNIDSKDVKGRTPLHLSVEAGYDVTELLVKNGANILSVDDEGNFPLHSACKCGSFETACLLLKPNPASINYQNLEGITPFMLAISNFDLYDIQYLLDVGARTDICDNRGKMVLHFATSLKNIHIFLHLVQSLNVTYSEQSCVTSIRKLFSRSIFPCTIDSYTCLAIQMGPSYLNILIKSHLPKRILQMPTLHNDLSNSGIAVLSPLAYLFFLFVNKKITPINECLDLLLEHEITVTDEFQRLLQTKWPEHRFQFVNPLSIVISSVWPTSNREYYFNLLTDKNVTTDYCLHSYHDIQEPFETFHEYKAYYGPVFYAIENGRIAMLQLLISNSVILEPDILCNYLINAYTQRMRPSAMEQEDARNLYKYLIYLKPVYHKWNEQSNLHDSRRHPFIPAADKLSQEALSKFYRTSYRYQKSPIFATIDESIIEEFHPFLLYHQGINESEPFPYITAAEEFAHVTLKQLCRTTIRQQLREYTLEKNLCNFKKKILGLPLPKVLKDYLLFKN